MERRSAAGLHPVSEEKDMCKVITIANNKGGTAKTTTTCNLGIGLARHGYRVLLIDEDPQGSLTASLGVDEPDELEYTLANVFEQIIMDESFDPHEGLLHHGEGVDLMPGNIELSGLDYTLNQVMARERILGEYVDSVKNEYDYILIDCMPSLNTMTINAFACADSVLIPVQAAYLSIKGLQQLMKNIGKVKRQINPKLEIEGILITIVDQRTSYARDIIDLLHEVYGNQVKIFDQTIPKSVRAEETTAEGISIFQHDPKGRVAAAYEALTQEIIRNSADAVRKMD